MMQGSNKMTKYKKEINLQVPAHGAELFRVFGKVLFWQSLIWLVRCVPVD